MASANTYDENLLSQAPEVTRAELQDGYNADLLREPTVKRALSSRVGHTPRTDSDPHQQYPISDKDIESSAAPLQPKDGFELNQPRKPWWRTRKGIAIIAVVAIAVILIAVLGGVLGSKNHRSNNSIGGMAGVPGGDQTQGSSGTGNSAGSGSSPPGSSTTSGSGATATVTQPAATGILPPPSGGGNTGGNGNNGGNGGTSGVASGATGGGGESTGTESGVLPQPGGAVPPSPGTPTPATQGRDEHVVTERNVLGDLGVNV